MNEMRWFFVNLLRFSLFQNLFKQMNILYSFQKLKHTYSSHVKQPNGSSLTFPITHPSLPIICLLRRENSTFEEKSVNCSISTFTSLINDFSLCSNEFTAEFKGNDSIWFTSKITHKIDRIAIFRVPWELSIYSLRDSVIAR